MIAQADYPIEFNFADRNYPLRRVFDIPYILLLRVVCSANYALSVLHYDIFEPSTQSLEARFEWP